MDRLIERLQPVNKFLGEIQLVLDFEGWELHSQFAHKFGLGRVAILGTLLGVVWGIHAALFAIISLDFLGLSSFGLFGGARLCLFLQWCFYVCSMCCFHLLEFFTTAIYNPTVTSSQSYLVNHSKAYTAAFLISSIEFWIKFVLVPGSNSFIFVVGMLMVLAAQTVRSWAMVTCGESFNHLIQTSKKENHVLVTDGIYQYLRHPSYVGFYYWSVGTQLVLNNWLSAIVFSAASLMFFRRRIPYEEESLMHHFPDTYLSYATTTWVGIPFIPSLIPEMVKQARGGKED